MRVAKVYMRCLERRPLLTKMVTSSTLFSFAEVLKSGIEKRSTGNSSLSSSSILKAGMLGGFIAAPSLHLWYTRALPMIASLQTRQVNIKKMLVDQVLFSPYFFGLLLSYGYLSKGFSLNEAKNRVSEELPKCMSANWKFWPLVQLFNFCYIPFKFQILFINAIGVFWQGYITHLRLNQWNHEFEF